VHTNICTLVRFYPNYKLHWHKLQITLAQITMYNVQCTNVKLINCKAFERLKVVRVFLLYA